jgi:hypothetical protein
MNGGRGTRSAGYTIVETLIFLAVTTAMFVSAMAFLNGRQAKAEFGSAVRNMQSSLQDLANDVSDGYYSTATSDGKQLTCGANVSLGKTSSGDSQGKNKDCIFVGKALQLAPDEANGLQAFTIISLAGSRLNTSGEEVTDYDEAKIKAIGPTNISTDPDTTITNHISASAEFGCAFYSTSATFTPAAIPCNSGTKTDLIAFITAFKAVDTTNGGTQVDLVVPNSSLAADIQRNTKAAVISLNQFSENKTIKNPAGKVYICIQGGINQYALLSLGGDSGNVAVRTVIRSGKCR